MPDALRLALGTFTVLPVPAPSRIDRRVAGGAMLLAPLVVAPLVLVWLVLAGAGIHEWLPPLASAGLALAAAALLSRGMHLDGLADTSDGLAASYERGRALDVMRRGDTGPAGTASIALVLLVDAGCLTGLFASAEGTVLGVVALVSSRLAPAVACRRGVPSARGEGLGHAVAGSVRPMGLMGLVGVLLGLATGAVVAAGLPWYAAGLVVLPSALAGAGVTRRARQRLGGITGDTIGAAIEIGLASGLVAASAILALLR